MLKRFEDDWRVHVARELWRGGRCVWIRVAVAAWRDDAQVDPKLVKMVHNGAVRPSAFV